ncbi:MAG: single-stranded DNA-binding protein [Betaproteobacteria bacterium]|nr:single-stranded DNA-binding protein [Betaproteobacteria bacterium]
MITAIVTGNLTKDPVLRTTASGKAMCSFSIASNTKQGDQKITTYVDVVCFEEQADVVSLKLHKGDRAVVSGRMALETFQKKDGSEGRSLRLVADDVALSLRFAEKAETAAGEPF